jgi:hypothetical protein
VQKNKSIQKISIELLVLVVIISIIGCSTIKIEAKEDVKNSILLERKEIYDKNGVYGYSIYIIEDILTYSYYEQNDELTFQKSYKLTQGEISKINKYYENIASFKELRTEYNSRLNKQGIGYGILTVQGEFNTTINIKPYQLHLVPEPVTELLLYTEKLYEEYESQNVK